MFVDIILYCIRLADNEKVERMLQKKVAVFVIWRSPSKFVPVRPSKCRKKVYFCGLKNAGVA